MAGVYKRQYSRARGKQGKWTGWYYDERGHRVTFTGTTDKATTLEIARRKESESRLVREGLLEPSARTRREAAARPIAAHIEDYRAALLAKGDTIKHARHVASTLHSLFKSASIESIAELAGDRVQDALARLKASRSARTANFALGAAKAFASWLSQAERVEAVPKSITRLRPYNERIDRRYVRRALSGDELERLLQATESGPKIVAQRAGRGGPPTAWLTGPDRAVLYRLAMGTGFRVNELRSLTPESFDLNTPDPAVTVAAAYSKHRRDDRQPIASDLADRLRPWLAGRPIGQPVLAVPQRTAEMLAADLRRAGIEPTDA